MYKKRDRLDFGLLLCSTVKMVWYPIYIKFSLFLQGSYSKKIKVNMKHLSNIAYALSYCVYVRITLVSQSVEIALIKYDQQVMYIYPVVHPYTHSTASFNFRWTLLITNKYCCSIRKRMNPINIFLSVSSNGSDFPGFIFIGSSRINLYGRG